MVLSKIDTCVMENFKTQISGSHPVFLGHTDIKLIGILSLKMDTCVMEKFKTQISGSHPVFLVHTDLKLPLEGT